jgi:hypothetical protein
METLVGIFMPCVGEVEGEHRGVKLGRSHVALHEAGIHPSFEQMGGVGMPEGMHGDAHFPHAGPVFRSTEGALDTGATHGGGCRRTVGVLPPGGGKEPGLVTRGFPGGAEQREGIGGQGDVPIFGALAAVDMDLEALAITVGNLEEEGVMESEAHAIDGGKGDLVVQGGGSREEALDLLHTEDSGETVGGVCAQERERVPIALEDVLGEEADTALADTQGRGGEAIDVFAVQEGVLELLFSDEVGGFVGELRQQTDCTERGFLSPFALATALKRCDHVLT